MGKITKESMEKIQLQVTNREATISPNRIRRNGQIPAVLYGNKIQNTQLAVNARDFEKVFRKAGESTIVELITADGKTHPVIIQDVQRHTVTTQPIHIDFYQVDMSQKLKANVPLEFTGEAPAVKALGGTLVKVLSEVEVECLPADLPHNLEVSIAKLNTFTDSIAVSDIKVSDKVKIVTAAEEVVAKVQPPRDVEAELATPVVEDVSAVEGAAEEKPAPAAAEGETPESKE